MQFFLKSNQVIQATQSAIGLDRTREILDPPPRLCVNKLADLAEIQKAMYCNLRCVIAYYIVNPFTVGNLLFWENFLLPECL